MTPIKSKSGLTDLLLIMSIVIALILVLTIVPKGTFNIYNSALMLLILFPTIKALIGGAPFVPTPMEAVQKMVEAAHIQKGEKVYDIGCGDGRQVYLAANKYGADATGFELSPIVYVLARIRKLFWRSKARIRLRNFKSQDFTNADVILCYLMPNTLANLQQKLDKELKKGARVISYAFPIGNWKETKKIERDPSINMAPIWIYQK